MTVQIPLDIAMDYVYDIETNFDLEIKHDFTVIDSFDASRGKFGSTLGNVALIDCNYAYRIIQTSYFNMFEKALED